MAPLILFFPLYFQGQFFSEVSPFHVLARIWHFFMQALVSGDPKWIYPGNSLGEPLFANTAFNLFTPQAGIALFLYLIKGPSAGIETAILALKISFFLGFALLYAGGLLCLEHFKLEFKSKIIVLLAFVSGGLFWSAPLHNSFFFMAWGVFSLGTFLKAMSHESKKILNPWGLLCIFSLAFTFLSGDPLMPCYVLILGLFFHGHYQKEVMAKSLFILLSFLLLVSPFIYAMLELGPFIARGQGLSTRELLSYSLHPLRFIEFFVPYFSTLTQSQIDLTSGEFKAFRYPSLFLNWPLAWAMLGGILSFIKDKKWPLLIVILAPLILSMGEFIWPLKWLWPRLLIFKSLRFPERFLLYFPLALLLLSGQGLKRKHYQTSTLGLMLIISWALFFALQPLASKHKLFSFSFMPYAKVSELTKALPSDFLLHKRGPFLTLARYKGCFKGPKQQSDYLHLDLRGPGAMMTNNLSNSQGVFLQSLDCALLADSFWPKVLGISALIWRDPSGEISTQETEGSPQLAWAFNTFLIAPFLNQHWANHERFLEHPHFNPSAILTIDPTREVFEGKRIEHPQGIKALESFKQQDLNTLEGPFFIHQEQAFSTMEISGSLKHDGLLVIPWRLLPGVRASLEGKPVGLLWAFETTMAVPIKAGNFRLQLFFEGQNYSFAFSSIFLIFLIISIGYLVKRPPLS